MTSLKVLQGFSNVPSSKGTGKKDKRIRLYVFPYFELLDMK